MSDVKIAVVTGSNKGIGYGIVKGLCERFDGKVYLTARNVSRGIEAVKKLNALGLKPFLHQLDVTDQESINKFRDHLLKEHQGIDILINNAAIGFGDDAPEPFIQQAEDTINVNYYGLLNVCRTLFPLMKRNGRVVNISSSLGHLHWIPSDDLKKKFSDPTLTIEKLNQLIDKFVSDVKLGKHEDEGWGNNSECTYRVSKAGVSALSIIQQKKFDEECPNRNISVNSVHPGFVDTDLTAHLGELTIEEGAEAPLFLALEEHGFKGKYVWCDKNPIEWSTGIPPSQY
ncbi:carbonyl reductase [NADPH] 1-like [Coccinella septempunctata]|uniref:carbonyl reductase [NADPH] 1-like n=1 Tax=Coccinella septempunctata TaxID=41139 RepID=UPI001D08E04B|nr:carbonyl reductase [NADPH] 1-like [Coccinella septempunctata]